MIHALFIRDGDTTMAKRLYGAFSIQVGMVMPSSSTSTLPSGKGYIVPGSSTHQGSSLLKRSWIYCSSEGRRSLGIGPQPVGSSSHSSIMESNATRKVKMVGGGEGSRDGAPNPMM